MGGAAAARRPLSSPLYCMRTSPRRRATVATAGGGKGFGAAAPTPIGCSARHSMEALVPLDGFSYEPRGSTACPAVRVKFFCRQTGWTR